MPSRHSLWLRLAIPAAALYLAGCFEPESPATGPEAGRPEENQPIPLYGMGAKPSTPEQLAGHYLAQPLPKPAALPAAVDFSNKAPLVGNQGAQGSCVGWAVSTLKSIQETQEEGWVPNAPLGRFSPAFIYNQINGGVDQGSFISVALDLLVAQGVDADYFFPYSAADFTTRPDQFSHRRAQRYRASSWTFLNRSVDNIKITLAASKPVAISLNVYDDFTLLNADNPVYDNLSGAVRGRHAVTLVGYDDARGAFRFQNSWGSLWGLSGYGWLAYSAVTDPRLGFESFMLNDLPNARNFWRVADNPRILADVNGDGRKDMVGFGLDAVYVSFSKGAAGFLPAIIRSREFGSERGFTAANSLKLTGDVNGDGRDDLVVFGSQSVSVARTNGNDFFASQVWLPNAMCAAQGWQGRQRRVADFDNDGKDDLIGFGDDGVWVALSNGSAFGTPTRRTTFFSVASGWAHTFQKDVADLNADGKADLIGFGNDGVYVALGTGNGWSPMTRWTTQFIAGFGTSQTQRRLADVNGDGLPDLVGYGLDGVQVGLSSGAGFLGMTVWSSTFGWNDGFQANSLKLVGDMSGDGKADAIVTADTDVKAALAGAGVFGAVFTAFNRNYAINTNEWFMQ